MIWSLRRPGRKYRINERFFGCKTLKTSPRVRKAEVSLDLSVISDSVEEQTDFSCFLSPVVLLNRPRSHWGRFWKLDRSEISLARYFILFEMDPRDPRPSQRPRSLIDEAEGQIQLLPVGNFLLFLFFLTSNSTRQLVWISLPLRALKPQISTRQPLRENVLPSSKVFVDTEREF